MGLNATPLIPYHAVDLPRANGVTIAKRGQLETRDYDVLWDGTPNRPGGRLLAVEEAPPAPKLELAVHLKATWRDDLDRGSTAFFIAFFLNELGKATVSEIVDALGLNRHVVSESLYRMRAKGFVKVCERKARPGGPPVAVWCVVD